MTIRITGECNGSKAKILEILIHVIDALLVYSHFILVQTPEFRV